MAEYLTNDTDLGAVADAIRAKGDTSAPLEFPDGFVDAIDDISTGTDTSDATATAGDILSGKTAYIATGKVTGTIQSKSSSDLTASGDTVSVPAGYYASVASKAVAAGTEGTPTTLKGRVSNHSVQVVSSVTNTEGYISGGTHTDPSGVFVNASELVSGTKEIDEAGTIDVTNYAAVSVPEGVEGTPTNVVSPVNNHSVIVSPRVTNTEGYIPGTQKVGNNTTIYASDLVSGTKTITGSGTTDVTNYAEASVAAGSASTPATSVTANPSINVSSGGLITASVSASKSVTPSVSAGWVSSGTAGTVSVSGSNTQQLTTQAAQTITPGTTDQTIAAGKYLTGAQTIKGDANLVAANIAKDVSIFGVTGTHEGGGGGGGTAAEEKDVNFIDYDGTVLYSYTAQEFANLPALPANPSHNGLTAQGWNWTLANAKTYVASYGKLWIGQSYIPTDGKTHIYVHIEEGRQSPVLGCNPNGTVVVDWGDGSATTTLTGTSLSTAKWTSAHKYSKPGDYDITLSVTRGIAALVGSSSTNTYSYLLRHSSSGSTINYGYRNAIKRIEIGSSISIGNYAFYYCYSLQSITIPSSVTSIGNNAFSYCESLRSITIPQSATSIGASSFSYCRAMRSVSMSNSLTSIGNSWFADCYSLQSVTIPNSVTTIGTQVFIRCYSLHIATIPNGITSVGTQMFSYCDSLQSVKLPDDFTSISNQTFSNCYSLQSVTIPSSVASIGSQVCNNCYSLGAIHFKPTTPPTVSNANAWSNVPTDCKIYVPSGSLSAYTSASNYPSSASYTYVGE